MSRLPTIDVAFTKEELFTNVILDIQNHIITTNVSLDNLAKERGGKSFYEIGNTYYDKEQYKKALAWYNLSTDKYYFPPALTAIGYMYRRGLGVSKNYLISLEYFLNAAERINPKSALHIASMFNNREGVPYNRIMEHEWFSHYKKERQTYNAFDEEDRRFPSGYFLYGSDTDANENTESLLELVSETRVILDELKEKASTKNKIESLEQKNIELEEKIQLLQKSNDSLEEVVNQLNAKVQSLEKQSGTTETEKKLAIMEIELLKKANHIMEDSTKKNTKFIDSIQKSLKKEREEKQAINQRLNHLERIFRQININRNVEMDDGLNRSSSRIIDDNNDLCYDNE